MYHVYDNITNCVKMCACGRILACACVVVRYLMEQALEDISETQNGSEFLDVAEVSLWKLKLSQVYNEFFYKTAVLAYKCNKAISKADEIFVFSRM